MEFRSDLIKSTSLEDGSLSVVVRVPHEKANKLRDQNLKAKAKLVKMNGFRPGHVPKDMVERVLGGKKAHDLMFSIYSNQQIMDNAERRIFMTQDVKVDEDIDTNDVLISSKVWVEPEVQLPEQLIKDPSSWPGVRIVNGSPDVASLVKEKIRRFADSNPYIRSKEDVEGKYLPAAEKDIVEVSIESEIDSNRFEPGCEKSLRLKLVPNTIHPTLLYTTLLGTTVDSEFSIQVSGDDIPGRFAKDVGDKKLDLKVKVLRVYSCEDRNCDDPDVLNELAITAGYESSEQWLADLSKSEALQAKSAHQEQNRKSVLDLLKGMVTISEIPSIVISAKVSEFKQANHPIAAQSNADEIIGTIMTQQIMLRAAGTALGVEWDDADKLDDERNHQKYAVKVLDLLVERVCTDADTNIAKISTGGTTESDQPA